MREYLQESLPHLRFEKVSRRIRVRYGSHGSQTLIDTTSAALVWEPMRVVPVYAVPEEDLDATLTPSRAQGEAQGEAMGETRGDPKAFRLPGFARHTCPGQSLDVQVGETVLPAAAFRFDDPDLAGYVSLDLGPFTWLEEDEEGIGHPHDPFKRIDILRSSRHVVVTLNGRVLADTTRATLLLETNLPERWYIPKVDIRTEVLDPSSLRTICAYKGHASYYSVTGLGEAGRDIAWWYPEPLHEAEYIRDLVCFWSERTELTVDGERLDHDATMTPR
jgi:uncharacterized protein (DUF427 family)